MKRILSLSALSLLAACSTTQPPADTTPGSDATPAATAAALDGPLRVPALASLPDSTPRTLGDRKSVV